jgi:hypothetical protein
MVLKKAKVTIYLSEDAAKYLRTKFKPDEGEKLDAFFEDFVRLEMKIDLFEPKVHETRIYPYFRRKTKQLSDEGKDITADALATSLGYKVNVAREWLHRMEEDGFIELVETDSSHRKHFKWVDTSK